MRSAFSATTRRFFLQTNQRLAIPHQHRPFSLQQQQQQTPTSNNTTNNNSNATTTTKSATNNSSSSKVQPVKIVTQPQQQQQQFPPGTVQNPMKETRTREGFRNQLFESENEKNMVKRGAIFSFVFALCLWLGTYYRAYLTQTNRGTLWLPAIFVYAPDEQTLVAQHFFGKTMYANHQGLDEMEDREKRLERMRQMEKEHADAPEL